jgi:hypothetical protein
MKLSRKRAEAVKLFLVSAGIDETRIGTVGYGPDKPIADNETKEGKEKNRRIEFRLLGAKDNVQSQPEPEDINPSPDREGKGKAKATGGSEGKGKGKGKAKGGDAAEKPKTDAAEKPKTDAAEKPKTDAAEKPAKGKKGKKSSAPPDGDPMPTPKKK